MNILFVKDWNTTYEEFADHWDGIMAAISEIGKKHKVTFVTKLGENNYEFDRWHMHVVSNHGQFPFNPHLYDAVVCWGSLDRPWHYLLRGYDGPKVLCFAGGPTNHPYRQFFDAMCAESKVYEDTFLKQGFKVVRAFGTNTKIFRLERRTPKAFQALYPASFCFHKNQELFARAMGSFGLCVGNHNEISIVGKVIQLGTPVLRRVSSEALADLYNMSSCVVLPGGPNSGAQRVVLESMACGTPVVVASDNDKCREFVEESGFGIVVEPVEREIQEAVRELIANPPDPLGGVNYVQSKWTEEHYAFSILKAISIAKS